MTDDSRKVLTDRQGHPVHHNQNQCTVGARGPATLENHHAYGCFEAYGHWGDEPIGRRTWPIWSRCRTRTSRR